MKAVGCIKIAARMQVLAVVHPRFVKPHQRSGPPTNLFEKGRRFIVIARNAVGLWHRICRANSRVRRSIFFEERDEFIIADTMPSPEFSPSCADAGIIERCFEQEKHHDNEQEPQG